MRLVPTQFGWAPFDAEARDFHSNLTSPDPIEVELLHDRDMVEHRRIMAIIGEVADALHTSHARVRAELLVATGNFQLLGELLGHEVVSVDSMSRHNMKDHELHAFWDEAKDVILAKLLPRITNRAARERLAETLAPQTA